MTCQNADGSWSFAIPRPLDGGTIIGGTKQPNDWNPYPLPEIRDTLLKNASEWFPFAAGSSRTFDVISDIVGRRPARRGGLRLELERIDVVNKSGQNVARNILHAYGIGGRGVELSWGIAEDAMGLLVSVGAVRQRAAL